MSTTQFTMDLFSSTSNDRDDFALGACNALAADLVDQWPDWRGRIKGLVLHGPADCGKSHLAAIWAASSKATIMTSLNDRSIHQLDDHPHVIWDHPTPSAAWPDDLVFHFLNRLTELEGSLLILSRTPMTALSWSLLDVNSRLNSLLAAGIDAPDDDILMAVMQKRADDCGLALDPEVARYIVKRIDRSFTAVNVIVDELNTITLAEKRKLSTSLARDVLARSAASGTSEFFANGEKHGSRN